MTGGAVGGRALLLAALGGGVFAASFWHNDEVLAAALHELEARPEGITAATEQLEAALPWGPRYAATQTLAATCATLADWHALARLPAAELLAGWSRLAQVPVAESLAGRARSRVQRLLDRARRDCVDALRQQLIAALPARARCGEPVPLLSSVPIERLIVTGPERGPSPVTRDEQGCVTFTAPGSHRMELQCGPCTLTHEISVDPVPEPAVTTRPSTPPGGAVGPVTVAPPTPPAEAARIVLAGLRHGDRVARPPASALRIRGRVHGRGAGVVRARGGEASGIAEVAADGAFTLDWVMPTVGTQQLALVYGQARCALLLDADADPPVLDPPPPGVVWTRTARTTIELRCAAADVASVRASCTGPDGTTSTLHLAHQFGGIYAADAPTPVDGRYRVRAWALDRAGHRSAEVRLTIQRDSAPPIVELGLPEQPLVLGRPHHLPITVSPATDLHALDVVPGHASTAEPVLRWVPDHERTLVRATVRDPAGNTTTVRAWVRATGIPTSVDSLTTTPLAAALGPDDSALVCSRAEAVLTTPHGLRLHVPRTSGQPVALSDSQAVIADGKLAELFRAPRDDAQWVLHEPLEGHGAGITAVALHDRQPIAVTGDQLGVVRIWDTDTGRQVGRWTPAAPGAVHALALAPQASHLAVAWRERGLAILERDGRRFRPVARHDGAFIALHWSSSDLLALTEDGVVHAVGEGGDLAVRCGRDGLSRRPATSFASDAAGSAVAIGFADGSVEIWQANRRRIEWAGHDGAVLAVRFDGRRRMRSLGRDGELRHWSW